MVDFSNPDSSLANARVQDFLVAWAKRYVGEPENDAPGGRLDDWQAIEAAIELIQETYSQKLYEEESRVEVDRNHAHEVIDGLACLDGLAENIEQRLAEDGYSLDDPDDSGDLETHRALVTARDYVADVYANLVWADEGRTVERYPKSTG